MYCSADPSTGNLKPGVKTNFDYSNPPGYGNSTGKIVINSQEVQSTYKHSSKTHQPGKTTATISRIN